MKKNYLEFKSASFNKDLFKQIKNLNKYHILNQSYK